MKSRGLKLLLRRATGRVVILAVTCVGALSAVAWQVHEQLPGQVVGGSNEPDSIELGAAPELSPESNPQVELMALSARLDEALAASRPVLLGSRDPNSSSCVNIMETGQVKTEVPGNVGDVDGGPGTTMGMLYYFDRLKNKTPLSDFKWHQTRLRTYLQNQSRINHKVGALVARFTQEARRFSEEAESWTSFPKELVPIGFDRANDWPSYCLNSLDNAIRARDLNETRRWATELYAAAFALEDLHRWAAFLAENQLTALDFQRRCESLFNTVESLKTPYDPTQSISQFPAGVLCLNGISNYYEVERQAETLYATPRAQVTASISESSYAPQSVAVMPDLREAFLDLQSVLSPNNRVTWELASQSPFHHAYMVNMLFRAKVANTVEDIRAALIKFDSIYPQATPSELMGALMYRGHSFAGLEWADRFQDKLIAAGNEISVSKSDSEALMEACRWTHAFYKPENYGSTLTLRDAIERQKLDCVRATDMISSILKNAGRTRMGHVRWSSETMGHSVAAYLGSDKDNQPHTFVIDGLNPADSPEIWPDAYFKGHEWPANLANNPTPYSVELYGRGIDGYIWAEGYIIRGPNAGYLITAGVPYFPSRMVSSTRKVYDGPYPQ